MIKVAYLMHSIHNHGGTERAITVKANYLADVYGYDVHIVTASIKGRRSAYPLSGKVKLHDVGSSDSLSPLYPHKLSKVLEDIAPDVAIAVGDKAMSGLIASGYRGTKIAEFHFSHEKYYMEYGGLAIGRLYASLRTRRLERMAAKFDKFVVLTEADRRDWPLDNVVHIFNPVTCADAGRSSLAQKRCIAVGRLVPQKNFDDAIAAWSEVAAEHPDWTLDIFGGGPGERRLGRLISERGLDGRVVLRGRSDNVPAEMAGSSMLLTTSRFEGFPMVLLEASEAGVPMVSYDCPKGPSEIIRDGENGFLVRPGDVHGLAVGICRLIEDEDLRRRMGDCAKSAAGAFDVDSIMAQWKSLLEAVFFEDNFLDGQKG